ncbi:hypothetical protein V9T40_002172 [Parthenolecanium corni]|uniref:Uncharacterized protein n=1 Tax=Parthenolecanium corni TaxID=536013 RepID=A0AAN9THY6_9HEMI
MPPLLNVCWPGDTAPIIEKKPVNYFQFHERNTTRCDKPVSYSRYAEPDSNLAAHHVISKSLLKKFYQIHSELIKENPTCSKFPQIDHRFQNILDHSQRKILTIHLWMWYDKGVPINYRQSSPPFPLPENAIMDDDEKFLEHLSRVHTWSIGGNLFMGPLAELRGPFDPSARGLDFEIDAEIILGSAKYQEAYALYLKIKRFVDLEKNQRKLDESEDIESSIRNLYTINDMTQYNEIYWEKRTATEDELKCLKKQLARKYRGKKFWAIIKEWSHPSASAKRSTNSTESHCSPSKRRCRNRK